MAAIFLSRLIPDDGTKNYMKPNQVLATIRTVLFSGT
jgi:hypothetical protein